MINMADSVITIPSNRIYIDSLSNKDLLSIMNTFVWFNKAKEELYNIRYNKVFLKDNTVDNEVSYIKQWLKDKSGYTPQDYYITSLESVVTGLTRSQKELEMLYKADFKARKDKRKAKLKALKRNLSIFNKAKENIIKHSRLVKDDPKATLIIPKSIARQKAFRRQFSSVKTGEEIYTYELWVDSQIKRIAARIHRIEEKGRRDEAKQNNPPARMTFGGGKAFYKKKDTITDIEMGLWHKERDFRRSKSILFSGRYDSKFKNWLCKYNIPAKAIDITMIDGRVVRFHDVTFPYRGDDLKDVLLHPKESGWSVGYWMERRIDCNNREYLLIKASFTLHEERMNYDISNGVISADLNYDNISWAELDSQGHRLRGGMIKFDISDKNTNQITDILGRASSKLVSISRKTKKPLVIEELDLKKKKASMAYSIKASNRKVSIFAYRKLTSLITGKAFRFGIGVIKVNPVYTSFIGKIKYLKKLRCPVHLAAAYVIGRRGMGFKEKVPQIYKKVIPSDRERSHHWKQFAYIYKYANDIPEKVFVVELPDFLDNKQLTSLQKRYA